MKKKIIDVLYQNSIEYIVNWRKHVKEYFWAIVIVLTLRANIGVFYRIPTGSMIPTFRVGDMLVANRFYTGLKLPFTDELEGYRLPAIKELEVGDVVIFLGPREEKFYNLSVKLRGVSIDRLSQGGEISGWETNPSVRLLRELNEVSKFKRMIYSADPTSQSGRLTKMILEDDSYIISDELYGDQFTLRLHHTVFKKYEEEIFANLDIKFIQESKHTMTYHAAKYKGFLFHLMSVPIAGLSMILDSIKDTPMLFFYRILLEPIWKGDNQTKDMRFYPNSYTDQSKEYVKRLIAKEGDKVEIRNKEVYVNDELLKWDSPFENDPFSEYFMISTEQMPHTDKVPVEAISDAKDGVFRHPLRLSAPIIKPSYPFQSDKWPYEPESIMASEFRDNFGPVIVPEGHYFMMGDNRDESLDSRYIGAVPKWAVKGTPMYIFLPWDRRGEIH